MAGGLRLNLTAKVYNCIAIYRGLFRRKSRKGFVVINCKYKDLK